MKAVLLAGHKKSGKTTLALRLIECFQARDLTVSVIKTSHHPFDVSDRDTDRLSQAANAVAGLAPNATHMIWGQQKSPLDLLPLLQSDILIIEGGKQWEFAPRIILPRSEDEADELDRGLAIAQWGGHGTSGLPVYTDVEPLAERILKQGFLLPGLDCSACGYATCGELARSIVSGREHEGSCQAVQSDLEINVNGQPIALNPFVRKLISGTLTGMLSSLKGYTPGPVTIRMEPSE